MALKSVLILGDIFADGLLFVAALAILIAILKLYKAYHLKIWLFPAAGMALFICGGIFDLADEFFYIPRLFDNAIEASLQTSGFIIFALGLTVAVWRLIKMAHTDPLTGAYNRRYLLENINTQIRKAKQSGSKLAVVFLDIDGFKEINDLKGYQVGDAILLDLALKLKQTIRPGDILARYGGDEFVVLLPDADRQADKALLQQLIRGIASLKISGGQKVGVSVGVAEFPGDGADGERLIGFAGRRMRESRSLRHS